MSTIKHTEVYEEPSFAHLMDKDKVNEKEEGISFLNAQSKNESMINSS